MKHQTRPPIENWSSSQDGGMRDVRVWSRYWRIWFSNLFASNWWSEKVRSGAHPFHQATAFETTVKLAQRPQSACCECNDAPGPKPSLESEGGAQGGLSKAATHSCRNEIGTQALAVLTWTKNCPKHMEFFEQAFQPFAFSGLSMGADGELPDGGRTQNQTKAAF
jgi:hypothetical protein